MDDQRKNTESNSGQSALTKNVIWLAGVVFCQAVAYRDSWLWLYRRADHSLEEVLGLIAVAGIMLCLALFSIVSGKRMFRFSLLPIVVMLFIYGASYLWATPPIFRAAIATLSVFHTVHGAAFERRPPVAYWGMILCALPVVASLQFYLGYPARLLCASFTVPLLRMNGLSVHREGTYLVWQNQMVQFDAPCSGITMLWAGVLLTFTLAYLRNFTCLKTIQALAVCGLFILFGNILRAASLFYLETGLFQAPAAWWHEAIGVIVFVATIAALLAAIERLNAWSTA